MKLRHIEVFHAIMQVGTISGAARLLNVTQPAVTKVLRHCEMQLGLALFVRQKGRLLPTPEAKRLFHEVEKIQRDIQAVRRVASSLKEQVEETVRVMATPTLSLSVLPPALGRWQARFPQAGCRLASRHTKELVNALLLGECDFALSLQDPFHPAVQTEVLARGPLAAIAPAGTWPVADSGRPLPVSGLPAMVIGLPDDDPLGAALEEAALEADQPLGSRIVVETYQVARTLVENGLGVAIIDPFTAASCHPLRVQARPIEPAIEVELVLLRAGDAPLSHAAGRLVQSVREAAQGLLEGAGFDLA